METQIIPKVYGIEKTSRGYAIALDVEVKKLQFDTETRLYYRTFGDIRYKKLDFAMKKADERVRHLYQDFVNFQGIQLKFTFENKGLLPEARTVMDKI